MSHRGLGRNCSKQANSRCKGPESHGAWAVAGEVAWGRMKMEGLER